MELEIKVLSTVRQGITRRSILEEELELWEGKADMWTTGNTWIQSLYNIDTKVSE